MSIKITPIDEAYPGSGYDTNERKSHLLAHAGTDFFRATSFLQEHFAEVPTIHVMLPLMHECIELLAKALVIRTDLNTTPKKHRHRTLKMMEKYKGTVPVFAAIFADPTKKELIVQLEKAYYLVKYGEIVQSYNFSDMEQCFLIAEELMDAYNNLTGVRLRPAHFLTQTSSP